MEAAILHEWQEVQADAQEIQIYPTSTEAIPFRKRFFRLQTTPQEHHGTL
jgi:hypothetical protein